MVAPGVCGKVSPVPGSTRSSTPSPVSSAPRAAVRTDPAAHWPPTNPSMEPSASTMARSPACAELGSCARTTVACTKGTRERVSWSMRSESWVVTGLLDRRGGVALHGVPYPGRGERHVGVPDTERLERVHDRVHDGRRGPHRRGLADPLRADGVVRRRGDGVPGLPVRDLERGGDQVV